MATLKFFRDRSRTALITSLLVLSLVLVGMLSVQTLDSVRSYQALAQNVLRDYAELAADEFIRRSGGEMTIYGFYPLLGSLAQLKLEDPLPTPEQLLASNRQQESANEKANESLARALGLARSFVRAAPESGFRLEVTGEPIPAAVAEALTAHLRGNRSNQPAEMFYLEHAGIDYNVLLFPVARKFVVGVALDNQVLMEWLVAIATRKHLLPDSVTNGALETDSVFVQLRDTRGRVLFEQGREDEASLAIEKPYSEDPTMYGSMTVRTAIDPAAASQLVIGGLPPNRLIILAGLWSLAALLIVLAIVLLRRERALTQMRSDFVSRVSHELRTPLTQILMFAQTLLLNRFRTDDERARALNVIDKEARRLTHLVDNILQFSRGERGSMELRLMPQRIMPLVRDITEGFRPLLTSGDVVLRGDIGDHVTVLLDVESFQQMLLNLLDNAVKYGPPGEDITVELTQGHGRVTVSVEDHGPGIPEPERQRIWEPYYRISDRRAAVAGTGIGLSVVRELAQLHNATVTVSERHGGGARFSIGFLIPAGAAA